VPRRIDAGEVLAAIGGLMVVVALFLSWFDGASGWEAFEALDLVLALLALAAIAAAIGSVTDWSGAPSPKLLPVLGALLLVIVVVQLIEPPPVFSDADPEREAGAWLALAGAALVLLGGILRASRISVTVSVGSRDVRRRVPAVDRRPSPEGAVRVGAPGSAFVESVPEGGDQATQPFVPAEADPGGHPEAAAPEAATPEGDR
jgi:drug/metabolite transporter superfamily protein YnfA